MRIAEKYLAEIIDQGGRLSSGPVTEMGVLRLALDLRAAREKLAELEAASAAKLEAKPMPRPRLQIVVEENATGKKVDFRA